jgi:hypothetical protein
MLPASVDARAAELRATLLHRRAGSLHDDPTLLHRRAGIVHISVAGPAAPVVAPVAA